MFVIKKCAFFFVLIFFCYICSVIFKLDLMDKKELIKIVIKVLIYTLTLIGGYFGVTSLTSCTIQRKSEIKGRAIIVTNDTTIVNHDGRFEFRSK